MKTDTRDEVVASLPDIVLETKGYDPRKEVKRAPAERRVAAVNAEDSYDRWAFALVKKTTDVSEAITKG